MFDFDDTSKPLLPRFPDIQVNKDLILREHTPADVKPFFEYYTHPQVKKYILAEQPRRQKDAAEEIDFCHNLFYHSRGIFWTLARRSDNRMIGSLGLYIKSHYPHPELCFELAPQYWRKGIMSSAIKRALPFYTKILKLPRIDALVHPDNTASINMLRKIGFKDCGLSPKTKLYKGTLHDVIKLVWEE
jgi:[ribosomal protein S5]-alanine N-acetyltransferase